MSCGKKGSTGKEKRVRKNRAEFRNSIAAFYDSIAEMEKKEAAENLALAKKQQAYYRKYGLNVSFDGLTTFAEIMNKSLEAERLLDKKWGLDEFDDDFDE